MRVLTALLALVALAGSAAALAATPLEGPAGPGADGALAPAAGRVSLPPGALQPAEVPQFTGAAAVVRDAAEALARSPTLGPEQLHGLAVAQHLGATVEGALPSPWALARELPPVPDLPVASLAPAEPLPALAPARAAAVAVASVGLAGLLLAKLPVLPLYSRIEREETMLNRRRSELYDIVRAEPGIHLSDLVRRSGLGWGAALYHLGVLEKNRVLVVQAEGGFKRYFANGAHGRQDMPRLMALRHEAARALFDAVRAWPGRSGRELADALGLSPSTLARASERLEEAGLLRRERAGRRVLYFPAAEAAPPAPRAEPVALAA